jgi:hypothetical protein
MAHVHLVLDVEVRLVQQREQFGHVCGDLVPQIRLDQGVSVEGFAQGGRGHRFGRESLRGGGGLGRGNQGPGRAQEDLSPEPFPTQSSHSWALCATVQVGRLQT